MAPDVLFRNTVRLPRDYYVRVHSNDYSVAPALIGRLVDVTADLEQVHVAHNGVTITSHDRAWARQLTITDPDHVIQAAVLRRQFQSLHRHQRPQAHVAFVESASLSDYDDVFGVDIGPGLLELGRLA